MNIFKKIKKHKEYALYKELSEEAFEEMYKHTHDADDIAFNYWAKLGLAYIQKMDNIKLNY